MVEAVGVYGVHLAHVTLREELTVGITVPKVYCPNIVKPLSTTGLELNKKVCGLDTNRRFQTETPR